MLLSIADGRPRNVETVTTESLFPTSLQTDSAKIISFIEEYYRYLNSAGLPTREISSITSARDIDSASNQYLDSIAELIAKNVPQSSSMDKVSLYKLIVKYYNTRGSEESAISFFKLFLDDIVTIFYPRDRLFDLSSGKIVWQQYEFPPIKLNSPPIDGALDIIRVGTSRIITFENPVPNKNIINHNDNVITYGDPLTYDGTIIIFDDLQYAGIVNGRYAYTDTGNGALYTYGLIYTGEQWLLHIKGIFPNNLLNTQDEDYFILEDEQLLEYQGAVLPNDYNQLRGVLNLEDTLNSIAEDGLAFVTENGVLNGQYFFDWTGVGAYWASSDVNAENLKLPPIDDGSTWTPGDLTTGDAYFSYFSGDIYGDVTLPDQTVYPDGKTNDYAQVGEWPSRTVYHCIDRGGVERDPEHRITWIEKSKDKEWWYEDRKGFASDQNIIQDSNYWQAFSYEIISSVSRNEWQDAFTKFVHPAGLKMFNTLLMQFFASNVWNDYIDYWKDITPETPNAWLEQLWPPWYKELGVARQQHSPRYQPGIANGGIPLEFITMYSQSDADRAALLRLVLLTYEFIILNAKSERYLVNEDYDSRGIKFIDQCPLREGILNRVIGDMTNRTGEGFRYKNENLSSNIEIGSSLDSYWVVGAASNNWSNSNNWMDGILPITGNNIFFGLSLIYQNLNNDISGLTLKNITFTSAASAFAISGNAFTQGDSSTITNNSNNVQSIANPIILGNGTTGVTANAASANLTLSGAISGAGKLIKNGLSTLTLSGTNTYTGNSTVNEDTLKAGSTTALSSGSAFSIASGATLDLNGYNNTIKGFTSSTANGTVTNTGNATKTLTIASSMGANSTVSTTDQLFTGNLALQLYGGTQGNVILTNANNTYNGGTTLGKGTGTTITRVLLDGGTYGVKSGGNIINGIFGTGAVTIGSSSSDYSQLYFGSAAIFNYDIVVNSVLGDPVFPGALRMESAGSILAGTINANLADVLLSVNNTSGRTTTITGTISGGSGLRILTQSELTGNPPIPGTGELTVTLANTGVNINTYNGNTTLYGTGKATLKLGAANQIPNGAGKGNLIITAGTFNMNGYSETINGLAGNGTVDGGTGNPVLTVGDNNAASTFAGVIKNTAGTLSLVKIGAGTLTLSGVNTYGGSTSITGGAIAVTKGIASAVFTPTVLEVTFSSMPSIGSTYQFFPGNTIPSSYASVTLKGADGRAGSYNSSNSTLTIS